jgi:hypothetical protein
MRAGKVALLAASALAVLVGLGGLAGGAGLVAAHVALRDGSGFYTLPQRTLTTPTPALIARVDARTPAWLESWGLEHPLGTVRVTVKSTMDKSTFVGIGPAARVDEWLSGTAYDRVVDATRTTVQTTRVEGSGSPAPPAAQPFWVASANGPGEQTLTWPSQRGDWVVVVMNSDATEGVSADVTLAAATGALLPMGIVVAVFGLLLLTAGAVGIAFALGHLDAQPVAAATAGVPGSYPVRLEGALQPDLSRWLWLVKWFLAIPHFLILVVLWLAMMPLTVIAGIAILFTGQYPRGLFDLNVGIMRWTWRVSYYCTAALGTDRYPPFSLHPDPAFPADLTVEYPQRLSRGLVLVKWWLLAIPHYLVIALFAGGFAWVFGLHLGTGGLIGILVLVAGVMLLVTGAYPGQVFDFLLGMNRWCYRVIAYAALMRDEYPPFRLDMGGTDPGSVPAPPPPPPPTPAPTPAPVEQPRELVGASGR